MIKIGRYKPKIVVPMSLQTQFIHWYHDFFSQNGMTRIEQALCYHSAWID